MRKILKVFWETTPLLFGVVLAYLFWQNNFLLAVLYAATVFVLLYVHADRSEITVFFYGVLVGSIVEVIGTQVRGTNLSRTPIFLAFLYGFQFHGATVL